MFKFHNKIKRFLIDEYAKGDVLDLASGRGGDILKYNDNKKIKSVTGFDINEDYVKEAIKRVKNLKNKRKDFSYSVKDLGKSIVKGRSYDTIVSNFAFHYFFKEKKTLDTILETIKGSSKIGTVFILTLFDGSELSKELKKKNGNIINKNYSIIKNGEMSNKKYGNSITVKLDSSVLDKGVEEFLVDPKFLEKKLKAIGFMLKESTGFSLYKELGFPYLDSENKYFSSFNRSFIFTRIK